MTKEAFETDLAVKALARRLYDWGVTEAPATKARLYIDELTTRGWSPDLKNISRRPPRRGEECGLHPGEYPPPNCRCCASEKAAKRDAEADAQLDRTRRTTAEYVAAAKAALTETRTWPHTPRPTPVPADDHQPEEA